MKNFLRALYTRLRDEPVLLSQIAALVISGCVAWGLSLSKEQELVIMGFAALVAALVGRSKVTPLSKSGAHEDDDGDMVAGPAAEGIPNETPVEVVPAEDVEPKSVEDKIWDNSTASGPVKPPVDWPHQL